jgi:hypothetical protein
MFTRKYVKNIAYQRCYNHTAREAVARCPECGRFFCRECVSEHEDRVLCASCLAKRVQPRFVKKYHLSGLLKIVQVLVSILILWSAFYLLGQMLLTIPSSFHEGTMWQKILLENE